MLKNNEIRIRRRLIFNVFIYVIKYLSLFFKKISLFIQIQAVLILFLIGITYAFTVENLYADDEIVNDSTYEYADSYDQDEFLIAPDVRGSFRFNFAVKDKDFIWKDANYLLQPGSWRYLYGEKRYNTHDPAIYNQFKLRVDAPLNEKFSVYTKVVIDPWSFVGRTRTITLPTWYGTTNANDPIDVQLKYWSSSAHTYPEIIRSETGDSFALPEVKVVDGYAKPTTVAGNFGSFTHRVDIPALKIDREFKPVRALWFDLKEDGYRTIVFLYAEENIGMYSDDPLGLVNNHVLWEPSPWLDMWKPGKLYTATGWENGSWDQDLFLKDTEGNWLTLLRSVRLEGEFVGVYTDFMVAAPLDLWDDYDTVNNLPLALRIKKELFDQLIIGSVYTTRIGYDQGSVDALDQAVAVDTELILNEYHKLKMETAFSKTAQNLNNDDFKVKNDDIAYKAIITSTMDPFDLKIASNISYTYMGRDFDPPLANYTYTKNDQSWGRHISFYQRSQEEEKYRIGNGIDSDRKVIVFDINLGEFEGMNTYFNIRNANRATDGKFLENVVRNETSYRANEQLLTKFLFIFHNRQKTDAGLDQDTQTYSGAFKYDFTDWVTLEQIYERTNEYPGFPDGIYSWLAINPDPPYPYFNITKTRLIFTSGNWLEIALEYTYNEFEYATTLDDFMNYSGIDIQWWWTDNFSSDIVYRYSRVADYLRNGKVIGHHNLYFDFVYDINRDCSVKLQFSELGNYIDGLGWQSFVLDTQHIIKIVCEGNF